MAHRIVFQVLATGTRVFGRAVTEAWRQAAAARPVHSNSSGSSSSSAGSLRIRPGMTLQEACQILNVKPPRGGETDMEVVMDRFKTLFDKNEPAAGGSFYLQSKVLRARERIEKEVREKEEEAEAKREAEEGWKPKIYRR